MAAKVKDSNIEPKLMGNLQAGEVGEICDKTTDGMVSNYAGLLVQKTPNGSFCIIGDEKIFQANSGDSFLVKVLARGTVIIL